jgi:DNA helicase-2/ATP-dependent DNA helicase PcrA
MPKKTKAAPKPIALTPEQQTVVDVKSGMWSVAAGPGAGKSTVLLARYVRLFQEGADPDNVLGLTFTAAAAKSLRDRAEEYIPVQKMDTRVAGFITFHSLCLSITTKERENFGFPLAEFPLSAEGQTRKITGELARKFELDWKQLSSWISRQKRDGVRPKQSLITAEKEGTGEKLALAYKAFDDAHRKIGVLDFDSMVMEVVQLLERNPQVRARWQFSDVLVDEAQDCDTLQFTLSKLISERHGNLMFIGDSGQSCYGFRGARSDIFRNLAELFPSVQTLYLGQNFRSTPEIVSFVKEISTDEALAQHFHTKNPSGPTPAVTGFASSVDQAEHIVREATPEGACLSRTNRGLADIENALSAAGVKYKLLGKCGFYQQAEIKILCAFLQCCIGPMDHAVLTCLRSPFHVTRYIKKKELIDHIKNKQKSSVDKPSALRLMSQEDSQAILGFVHFLDSLRRYRDLPPADALKRVVQDLQAIEHYQEEGDPDNYPVDNIKELIKLSGKFGSIRELLDYIRKVSAASRSRKAFTLSTIHGSKGLQWPKVMVASVNDGMLPHSKGDLEEERNLFFIACSRPERELQILYHGRPSQFLQAYVKKQLEEVFA